MQFPRVLNYHASSSEFQKQHQEVKEQGHLAISCSKQNQIYLTSVRNKISMPSCTKRRIVWLSLSLSCILSLAHHNEVLQLLSQLIPHSRYARQGCHQFANTTIKFRQLIPPKQTRTASMSFVSRYIQFKRPILRFFFFRIINSIPYRILLDNRQTKIYKQHQIRNSPHSIINTDKIP